MAITATKTYTIDADGDGKADAGDVLTYTIVISNDGSLALGTIFTDTLDPNTTFVPGSLSITPLALDDSFSAIGNVRISSAAPGVLANDADFDGGVITATAFTGLSSQGGEVTLNPNGSFSYEPPAGFEGTDTFSYTLTDDEGDTTSGVVSISVSGLIWFINNSAGACSSGCNGRLTHPFTTLAAFQAVNNGAGNNPAIGDNIFIHTGSGSYNGGVTLLDNQKLFGQGATASLSALTGLTPPPGSDPLPPTNGPDPILANSGGHVIQIEDGNRIAGLSLSANSVNPLDAAIFGSADAGATSVDEVSITTSIAGSGLILNSQGGSFNFSNGSITGGNPAGAVGLTGGTGVITFTNTTINRTGGGLIAVIGKTGGSLSFTGGSITGSTLNPTPAFTAVIVLQNNPGIPISFGAGFNVTISSGGGLLANNGGVVTIGGTSSVINTTNGPALDVTGTTFSGGATLATVSSTNSGTNGVNLNNVSGTVTMNGGSITGATGAAFNVSGGTVSATYNGNITQANNAALVSVSGGHSGGTLTFQTGTLNATNGAGLQFDNADGVYNFTGTTTLNGGDAGVDILNGSTGTFNFSSGASITNPSGDAFTINASNATGTYSGSISDNTGFVINIDNHDGGTYTFDTGSITSTASGIRVQNSNGGTINFNSPTKNLNTGTNKAVTLDTNNGSGTVNFGNGGLNIDTTSATGFSATGGGTVTVTTGANPNTIDTTTGTALNIANTTIGANDVTFQSISANGASSGIVLNNTGGSGGLHVTGNGNTAVGGDDSGGTVQNTTGIGISLLSTFDASFTNMRVMNTVGAADAVTDVTNFTFNYGKIDDSNTDGNAANGEDSNIGFNNTNAGTENNLDGTVSIVGNQLTNAQFHGIDIFNFSGTINDITMSDNTITSATAAANSQGSGIRLVAFGSATTIANITKATINNNDVNNFPSAAGIQVQGGNGNLAGPATGFVGHVGSATDIISITDNDVSGQNAANQIGTFGIAAVVNGRGEGNFFIGDGNDANTTGNTVSNTTGNAIAISSFGFANTFARVNDNIINANNEVGAAAIGAGTSRVLGAGETPTLTVYIERNDISFSDGNCILVTARDASGTVNARIIDNIVDAPLSGNRNGIRVDSGNGQSTDETVNLEIRGNTSAGSGLSPEGIGLRKQGTVATTNDFNIYDASGGPDLPATPTNAQVVTFVSTLNPTSANGVLIIAGDAFRETTTQPLLAAEGGVEAAQPASMSVLTQSELDILVAAAIERWTATGLTAKQLAAMRSVKFEIADLPGVYIAEAAGDRIRIDRDAGSYGWFVDTTPMDDVEFSDATFGSRRYTDSASAPAGRMDLLTAIMHELGHSLHLPDSYAAQSRDTVMYGYLTQGERRIPSYPN